MRPRSPRCEVRLGRLKSALAAVGGVVDEWINVC
jgi:hypothetical protein